MLCLFVCILCVFSRLLCLCVFVCVFGSVFVFVCVLVFVALYFEFGVVCFVLC